MPPRCIQLIPNTLHIIPDGSKTDAPSFVFELAAGNGETVVVAQLSFEMILKSLPAEAIPLLANEFNRILRPQAKPMTEQDMINFFNFEMGGPFNQNLNVNMGGSEC